MTEDPLAAPPVAPGFDAQKAKAPDPAPNQTQFLATFLWMKNSKPTGLDPKQRASNIGPLAEDLKRYAGKPSYEALKAGVMGKLSADERGRLETALQSPGLNNGAPQAAAQLTHKSAESEGGNFKDFLHRHWEGPQDSPVYFVPRSDGKMDYWRGFDTEHHMNACIAGGLKYADKPLDSRPNDPLYNGTNPCELGGQWLKGTGPRHQSFHDGDPALRELQRHDHIQHLREDLRKMAASGTLPKQGNADYHIAGPEGKAKFGKDSGVHCLQYGRDCERGNLTVAFLGSYSLKYTVISNDASRRELTVHFNASNKSDLVSLLHPPVRGYTKKWRENVEPFIEKHEPDSGPISATTQSFEWTEIIKY